MRLATVAGVEPAGGHLGTSQGGRWGWPAVGQRRAAAATAERLQEGAGASETGFKNGSHQWGLGGRSHKQFPPSPRSFSTQSQKFFNSLLPIIPTRSDPDAPLVSHQVHGRGVYTFPPLVVFAQ